MDWYGWMVTGALFLVGIVIAILLFVYGPKDNKNGTVEVHIINPNVGPDTITCVEHDWDFKPLEPDKFPFLG